MPHNRTLLLIYSLSHTQKNTQQTLYDEQQDNFKAIGLSYDAITFAGETIQHMQPHADS